jgi:N utilization substance protein B
MSHPTVSQRREARRIAMTIIYSWDISGYGMEEVLELTRGLRHDWKQLPEFTEALVKSVVEHAQDIETEIGSVLQHWKPERIAPVEKALLKLGAAEIMYHPEIPPRVTINEYIELAKTFTHENSPAFINGILDKLVQLREKKDFTKVKPR